jgi:hypothetical protein
MASRARHAFALLLSCLAVSPAGATQHKAGVVVYGATASGVIAAVAVAGAGRSVLLVEPGKHVGGMVSGGLGATDFGNRAAIGGYSREFFDRVRAYYTKKYGAKAPQLKDCAGGFHFEPHVATLLFKEMLKEAKVEVLFGQRLEKVQKKGTRIAAFTTAAGDTFAATVFIDASYEGDLMAKAGVKYHVGREARATYNESLAGVQAFSKAHQWPVPISGLDAKKKFLPFIQPGPAGAPGAGDRKVQAYNFRLCMTDRKDNQVPWPKPPGYDPGNYELLARYLAKRPGLKVGQLMNPVRMPNGKTDTNNNGPFSTDHIGANWDYPEADHATRQRIWKDHVLYTQGLLYFLANDPRVPKALQAEMRRWGLARDEFTDTGHWPHQLYVREARRMLGAHVMTQADIMDKRTKEDSVGLGSYNTDSHHVQRVLTRDGTVHNEGDFQVAVRPYAIPYRSLTPRPAECTNLLVPVCMSASHVAYGTVRMEPVYMILGQASGVAAALAVKNNSTVQKVPVSDLQALLKQQKAVLSPEGLPGPKRVQGIDPKKLPGIVIDDTQATRVGNWKESAAVGPFVGTGYLHDGDADKGKMLVRYTPKLPRKGKYEVRLFFPPASNRAGNALVVIVTASGKRELRVDQRKPRKGTAGVHLGTFELDSRCQVEVRNDGTRGHVIADAVQFLRAEPGPRGQ